MFDDTYVYSVHVSDSEINALAFPPDQLRRLAQQRIMQALDVFVSGPTTWRIIPRTFVGNSWEIMGLRGGGRIYKGLAVRRSRKNGRYA